MTLLVYVHSVHLASIEIIAHVAFNQFKYTELHPLDTI